MKSLTPGALTLLLVTMVGTTTAWIIGPGVNSGVKDNGAGYFPGMQGIDLHGETQYIPERFDGRLNIVMVGFQRWHQSNMESWTPAVKEAHTHMDNVEYFEIPVIHEMNTAGRAYLNNAMRRGIQDADARSRTITVYVERSEFTALTGMDEQQSYVLLVDGNGKILWSAAGAITAEAKTDMYATMKNYLGVQ
eukprot:GFYU01008728.1.p2 GENE.GFYU01008728.1~~GFYU01008728.1.p2  ORF type:complete len:192 (-),score=68.46 GFYU01008728.1:1160-1735(-)